MELVHLDSTRAKPADERAIDLKTALLEHLEAVAALMNEAAKESFEVTFNVQRNTHGVYVPVDVKLTKSY